MNVTIEILLAEFTAIELVIFGIFYAFIRDIRDKGFSTAFATLLASLFGSSIAAAAIVLSININKSIDTAVGGNEPVSVSKTIDNHYHSSEFSEQKISRNNDSSDDFSWLLGRVFVLVISVALLFLSSSIITAAYKGMCKISESVSVKEFEQEDLLAFSIMYVPLMLLICGILYLGIKHIIDTNII